MKGLNLRLALLLLLFSSGAFGQRPDDGFISLLKGELEYSMGELKKQDAVPYYMSFRVNDLYNVDLSSSFGAASGSSETKWRSFVPQVRLGSPELDNFKYVSQGGRMTQAGQVEMGTMLPRDDGGADALREALWRGVLSRYEYALDVWSQTQSRSTVSVADEDKAGGFSEAPVEQYYEAPLPEDKRRIDMAAWQARLDEISAVFKSFPELQQGTASLSFESTRTYFLDTEGREVVQNRVAARLVLSASLKALDGMELPLNEDYFAYDPAGLPDNATVIAAARDMVDRLKALEAAPVADPYTGPAILSGPASGVFFHEIFGHRLEGHRLKTGGQTFKKMVGERVLPADFAVYCDPTLTRYAGTDLNGHYVYDDEGVKARRVDNVVGGVLKEFLMSRVPLDGFPASNGHGRATGGGDPVSRQSNLVIETSHPYTEAELRAMLVEEAKRQGKAYGYYIRTVTSGFTYTGEGGSLNSFNVMPLEVYRVYVDGRPDELVRGVDMIGTPLSMFSNIVAGGDTPEVFTGQCGAESGWVPVTTASPMIYVSQIETQRRAQSRDIPALLPAPEGEAAASADEDATIFSAMQDELDRNLQQLALPQMAKPYYISYILERYRRFQVTASLGSVMNTVDLPQQSTGSVQLLVGGYAHNNDMQYVNQVSLAAMPVGADYYNIRRGFWAATDEMFRYALGDWMQKENYLKSNPLSAELASLPDMQELPAVTRIEERTLPYEYDIRSLEELASRLSAIFKEYRDIFNSSVVVNGTDMDIYRLTSEGVKLKQPAGMASVIVTGEVRTAEGTVLRDNYSVSAETPGKLPDVQELETAVRAFADRLLALKSAPLTDSNYKGPVLYEDGAVPMAFNQNMLTVGGLVARRMLQPSPDLLENRFGEKILDSRLSVKNLTGLEEYNGTRLWGHYAVDADGVEPAAETVLVEGGVLKGLLNGRCPTLKAPVATGCTRFMVEPTQPASMPTFGTVHISVDKGTDPEKMKKALQKAAKSAGQNYGYIVRRINGGASEVYRVSVKDGSEEQVRVGAIPVPSLSQLEKLGAISSGEQVLNLAPNSCLVSLICPDGMIVDGVEIARPTPKTEKAPAIPAPQQR